MDDDEFNDFQQAVQLPQETQPENRYQQHDLVKEQTHFLQNKSTPIDTLLINPSSCLPVEPIQPPNIEIEIKDSESSSQPHLNKIQSEKSASHQDVFFNLDQNYSHSEPNIELIDYTNANFIQEKNLFNEILADQVEDSTFQNLENTNFGDKNKTQDQQWKESSNKEQYNLDLQKSNLDEDIYYQSKFEKQVKEDQQQWTKNYQQQNKRHQAISNSNNHQLENKEIKSQSEQSETKIQKPTQLRQQQKRQQQEDEQFGDFQQTIPTTPEYSQVQIQNVQNIQQHQDYKAEISQSHQTPPIVMKRDRKQQLKQLVNSLSDYSFLFLQAFQSF